MTLPKRATFSQSVAACQAGALRRSTRSAERSDCLPPAHSAWTAPNILDADLYNTLTSHSWLWFYKDELGRGRRRVPVAIPPLSSAPKRAMLSPPCDGLR